jgi:hypothetical protein
MSKREQYARLFRFLSFSAAKSKILRVIFAYSIIAIIVVYLSGVGSQGVSPISILSDINLWFLFGFIPVIIVVYGYFYSKFYSQNIISNIVTYGFNRKYLLCTLFVLMFAIIFLVFIINYIIFVILYGLIDRYIIEINLLRILLSASVLYMYSGFAMLLTTLTKSFLKSTLLFLSITNIMSLCFLLSVNILKTGYFANYFTLSAIPNAIISADFSENYIFTIAFYLVFGVVFNLISYKNFKNADIM